LVVSSMPGPAAGVRFATHYRSCRSPFSAPALANLPLN
jgi:hypothetical protein